jgi:hypothetical protein
MAEVWNEYRDAIAGGWKLVSYDMYKSSGTELELVAKPHGDDPMGRVYVSRHAWLSAHLATPDRMKPRKSGKPWQTAPDDEIVPVARGITMYCGYASLYRTEAGQVFWQTKVEVASDPGMIGSIQERKVTLSRENGKSYMTLEPTRDLILEVCVGSLMFGLVGRLCC